MSAATAQRVADLQTFISEEVRPAEAAIEAEREAAPDRQPPTMEALKTSAKAAGLWNLCAP